MRCDGAVVVRRLRQNREAGSWKLAAGCWLARLDTDLLRPELGDERDGMGQRLERARESSKRNHPTEARTRGSSQEARVGREGPQRKSGRSMQQDGQVEGKAWSAG